MSWVLLFLAGALIFNAVPHVVSGLRGDVFPTPFAKPRGVGNSSALTNFLWGFANLAIGLGLALNRLALAQIEAGLTAMAAGGLAIGLYLATHFGKVRGGK